jgi:hypothetical protein
MNKTRTDSFDQQRLSEAAFVIVDFETITPARKPPEPIELAAMRVKPGLHIDQHFRANWLIKPPDDAPFTTFDTHSKRASAGKTSVTNPFSGAPSNIFCCYFRHIHFWRIHC